MPYRYGGVPGQKVVPNQIYKSGANSGYSATLSRSLSAWLPRKNEKEKARAPVILLNDETYLPRDRIT